MRTVAFWLSLFMIFVIPWENSIDIEGVGTVSRTIGLVVAVFWMATIIVTGKFRKPHSFHLAIYLFIVWNIASTFWSFDVAATLDRLQTYIQLLFMIFILWDLYNTPGDLRAGLQAYVLGAYVAFGSTFVNYLTGNEESFLRYAATGFNANDLGPILALGIPIAWYLAITGGNNSKLANALKVVNYAYIPAGILGILLSGTRGAMIAALPAIVFILSTLTRLRFRTRVMIFIALIGTLFALQTVVPQYSIERLATTGASISELDLDGRVNIWRQGIKVFSEHPLLGVGSSAFRTAVGIEKVAHNTFISVLVEVGIIGWVLFGIILAITFYQAIHQPKLTARFWLTVLLVWALTASFMTWEQRKQTWLILSLVIVSAGLSSPPVEAATQVIHHRQVPQVARKREENVYLE